MNWLMRMVWIVIPFAVGATLSTSLPAREWTSIGGKHKVIAEYVACRNGHVILEKSPGEFFQVPLERLSEADQAFVREQLNLANTKPTGSGSTPESPDSAASKAEASESPFVPKSNITLVKLPGDDQGVTPAEVANLGETGWGVKSLAFSPSGRFLAAGKPDRALLVFDLVANRKTAELKDLEELSEVASCAFTPDEKKLVVGGGRGLIAIFNLSRDGRLTDAGQFAGHTEAVRRIAISANGRSVLSAGKVVRHWDLATGKEIAHFRGLEYEAKALWLSPDDKTAMATDGGTLLTIDLKLGTEKKSKLNSSWASGQFAAFAPDGSVVAAGDGYKVVLFNARSSTKVVEMEAGELQWCGAFTPDGKRLLTGGSDVVNVWDVSKQSRVFSQRLKSGGYVQSIAASPTNRHMSGMTGNAGGVLQVFRLPEN